MSLGLSSGRDQLDRRALWTGLPARIRAVLSVAVMQAAGLVVHIAAHADRIEGKIELGIGHHDEPYEAIGRGSLNIEKIPILRDFKGAFGSPTSDSLRTMVKEGTWNFLMVFFDFSNSDTLQDALHDAEDLYRKYCNVKKMRNYYYLK